MITSKSCTNINFLFKHVHIHIKNYGRKFRYNNFITWLKSSIYIYIVKFKTQFLVQTSDQRIIKEVETFEVY